MLIVNIYKQEDPNNIVACLKEGEHNIGRGNLLQCNDQRVSRNHALINITEDKATLTAVHINPCFFMAANSTTITIITKDTARDLNDNDHFALLPDCFWFRVKLITEAPENNNSLKRHSESATLETENKRLKIEEDESEPVQGGVKVEAEEVEEHSHELQAVPDAINEDEAEAEPDALDGLLREIEALPPDDEDTIKTEEEVKSEVQTEEEVKGEVKIEDTKEEAAEDAENQPAASTSDDSGQKTKSRRERCWYVPSCFRKNPKHRDDFSHPGDADYDSDPSDDRPTCSYAPNCYRRNLEHRREYKHPNRPAPKPKDDGDGNAKPTTGRKKRAAALKKAKTTTYAGESSEDDYDLEDPFIDDSEDEYVAPSESSDSETVDPDF